MPTSIFLARLIGPLALVIGIGLVANAAAYRKLVEEFLRSHALIYLSGILAMTGGLAVVLAHNVWTADWRVVITLLGWLAAIGGAARIVVPQLSEGIGRWLMARPASLTAAAVVWLAIGALLCFFGYFR
jgi:uncharacterized membrane protein